MRNFEITAEKNSLLAAHCFSKHLETELLGLENPIVLTPLFENYFDDPVKLSACVLWLLNQNVKPELIINSTLLHRYLAYHSFSVSDDKSDPISQLYNILGSFSKESDSVLQLVNLAKTTACGERAYTNSQKENGATYSSRNLMGSAMIHNNLLPIVDITEVDYRTASYTENNASALYRLFGFNFIRLFCANNPNNIAMFHMLLAKNQRAMLREIKNVILNEETKIHTLRILLNTTAQFFVNSPNAFHEIIFNGEDLFFLHLLPAHVGLLLSLQPKNNLRRDDYYDDEDYSYAYHDSRPMQEFKDDLNSFIIKFLGAPENNDKFSYVSIALLTDLCLFLNSNKGYFLAKVANQVEEHIFNQAVKEHIFNQLMRLTDEELFEVENKIKKLPRFKNFCYEQFSYFKKALHEQFSKSNSYLDFQDTWNSFLRKVNFFKLYIDNADVNDEKYIDYPANVYELKALYFELLWKNKNPDDPFNLLFLLNVTQINFNGTPEEKNGENKRTLIESLFYIRHAELLKHIFLHIEKNHPAWIQEELSFEKVAGLNTKNNIERVVVLKLLFKSTLFNRPPLSAISDMLKVAAKNGSSEIVRYLCELKMDDAPNDYSSIIVHFDDPVSVALSQAIKSREDAIADAFLLAVQFCRISTLKSMLEASSSFSGVRSAITHALLLLPRYDQNRPLWNTVLCALKATKKEYYFEAIANAFSAAVFKEPLHRFSSLKALINDLEDKERFITEAAYHSVNCHKLYEVRYFFSSKDPKVTQNRIVSVMQRAIEKNADNSYNFELACLQFLDKSVDLHQDTMAKILIYAAKYNKLEIVKYICELTTKNKPDKSNILAAFYTAAQFDNLDVVKYLCSLTWNRKPNNAAISKVLTNAKKFDNPNVAQYLAEKKLNKSSQFTQTVEDCQVANTTRKLAQPHHSHSSKIALLAGLGVAVAGIGIMLFAGALLLASQGISILPSYFIFAQGVDLIAKASMLFAAGGMITFIDSKTLLSNISLPSLFGRNTTDAYRSIKLLFAPKKPASSDFSC